jgi:hypothetical protein
LVPKRSLCCTGIGFLGSPRAASFIDKEECFMKKVLLIALFLFLFIPVTNSQAYEARLQGGPVVACYARSDLDTMQRSVKSVDEGTFSALLRSGKCVSLKGRSTVEVIGSKKFIPDILEIRQKGSAETLYIPADDIDLDSVSW